MAVNLKIQGNFLILSDTLSLKELLCAKRSEIIPKKNIVVDDPPLTEYFYNFLSTTYTSGGYKTQNANSIEFNDFIDDRTGAKFTSVDDLDEFLRLNLGGNNAPVLVLKETGWASYIDGEYTDISPFVLSADTDTILPNNALNVIDSQKPEDVETFYTEGRLFFTSLSGGYVKDEEITGATSGATAIVQYQNTNYLLLKEINGTFVDTETITGGTSGATSNVDGVISEPFITGRNGDNLDITLYFSAESSLANQWLDVWIDIGGSIGELYRQTFAFPKGTSTIRGVLYSLSSAYTLNTWEANGGNVYVRSNGTVNIYGINYNFDRSHKSR